MSTRSLLNSLMHPVAATPVRPSAYALSRSTRHCQCCAHHHVSPPALPPPLLRPPCTLHLCPHSAVLRPLDTHTNSHTHAPPRRPPSRWHCRVCVLPPPLYNFESLKRALPHASPTHTHTHTSVGPRTSPRAFPRPPPPPPPQPTHTHTYLPLLAFKRSACEVCHAHHLFDFVCPLFLFTFRLSLPPPSLCAPAVLHCCACVCASLSTCPHLAHTS